MNLSRYQQGTKAKVQNLWYLNRRVRRLAKGKVMEVRQRAFQVNHTSFGLSAENELGGARIFDHLTPKKQNLLFEAKKIRRAESLTILLG